MARQLVEAGEEVPVLALLDPDSPEQARRTADVEEAVLLAHLAREQALQAGRPLALTADDLRPLDAEARVERVLAALSDAGLAAGHIEVSWVRRLLAGYNARKHAVAAYQPRVYAGRVVLFAPAEHDADAQSTAWWTPGADDPGWHAYSTRPLQVHVVPGQHATLATGANAEHVARHLRAAIDDSLSSP
jgi:thioesterase domain-containing protein